MGRDLPEPPDYWFVQRTVALLLVATVVLTAGIATVGVASGESGVAAGGLEQMDVDPDDVLIEVAVEPNGDAVWTIEYRVELATEEERRAFEDLRTDVGSDPENYTSRFRERMVSTADAAENATGREMTITNTTVTAEREELPQSYGVVTYRFEWSNFAGVDGDRLLVGDAIDGMFLDETSSLIVSWPDGYQLAETSPSPTETREGSVVWNGPIDFTGGEPRVTIAPDDGAALPLLLVGAGLLVAVVAVIAYRRRPWDGSALDGTAPGSAGGASEEAAAGTAGDAAAGPTGAADGNADEGVDVDSRADPQAGGASSGASGAEASVEPEASTAAGAAGTAGTTEATPDDADGGTATPVDEELLSNEEQVLHLIEANGGRMKQKRVAEELDWTAAKTSQVVTGLREDDDLDGFRLGRENVLSLPEFDAESGAESDGVDVDGGGE